MKKSTAILLLLAMVICFCMTISSFALEAPAEVVRIDKNEVYKSSRTSDGTIVILISTIAMSSAAFLALKEKKK